VPADRKLFRITDDEEEEEEEEPSRFASDAYPASDWHLKHRTTKLKYGYNKATIQFTLISG
jgi:hypothetical protein